MEKTIMISGIPCKMKSNAALPRIFRKELGKDLFEIIEPLKYLLDSKATEAQRFDAISALEDLAHIMHRYGDPSQPESVEEWLAQFNEPDAIFNAFAEIIDLWNGETATIATDEKKTEKQNEE